ncbi:MAG: FAD-binding oxidoreductase [Thermoproteota archaeon]|nr:FAD-binding oxidoreductase [Thermoproteota archaeon]
MHEIYAEKPRKDAVETELEHSIDPSVIENYLTDESVLIRGNAEEVVFPRTEEQIAEVLRNANEKNVRVTVSGAGTGITGARVPQGGTVLSTEKFTDVFPCGSPENLLKHSESNVNYSIYVLKDEEKDEYYAVAPPGVPLEVFDKMVEQKHLFYPPDPTEKTALLGATAATDASGSRTFHYGSTRRYVRRLRIVLANGDILDVPRGKVFSNEDNEFVIVLASGKRVTIQAPSYTMPRVRKNAAGYYAKPGMDLIDLFIGSEGTLGVISEVEVKLQPPPARILPVFAHFRSEADALNFVRKLRETSWAKKSGKAEGEIDALSIEFLDEGSLTLLRKKYPPSKIPSESKSAVFFEQEFQSEEVFNRLLEQIVALLESCNVLRTLVSLEADWKKEVKDIRHALPESINTYVRSMGVHKVATDIVVPDEALEDMMNCYHEVGEKSKVPYVNFGHVGDSHLHFNFLPGCEGELKRAEEMSVLLLKKAVELGGTVSGEHGVGKKTYVDDGERPPYLQLMYGVEGLKSIAKIKHALDPNHILNVGNIVPFSYLESLS